MEIGVTSNKTPDVTDVTKIPSAPRVFEFFRVDLVYSRRLDAGDTNRLRIFTLRSGRRQCPTLAKTFSAASKS